MSHKYMKYMFPLTAPGRHESRALTSRCEKCGSATRPTVVLDLPESRQAGYDCPCSNRWVKIWGPTL
jgi:hypothetical protein